MITEIEKPIVRIKIAGVGGGGTNAVARMLAAEIPTVTYVTINTDDAGVRAADAQTKLQIGKMETRGRGAGADPAKGLRAAEENRAEIEESLKDCDMLFITAGMGGGTGTGAAPIVAEIARKLGILTVAVVTKPFAFEGKKRMDTALDGIAKLEESVDSLVVIPNENLKHASTTRLTLANAFAMADDVLMQTVKNLVEVIQNTGYINCDFADIQSVIRNSGHMHTASGQAAGDGRTDKILAQIGQSALLDSSVDGADGVMLCIIAAPDAGLDEIDHLVAGVTDRAAPGANVIFGMRFDESMGEELKTVLISTKKA